MKIKERYLRFKQFLSRDIWTLELENLGKARRNIVQSIRITSLTFKTFSAQKIGFQSVALSFFCTMAVVPALAVALALTKGLGLSDKISEILYANITSNPEIVERVMTYADNIIQKASSSALGAVSAAFFVWLVIWMMINVESVFNNVWKVEKGRSFATKFWRDTVIVILAPLLMILFYFSVVLISGFVDIGLIKWPLMALASILIFSAMYKYIPNTKVYYRHAIKAAIFSGITFCLLQFVYVESQIFLSRLSGVYGAVAAIPFFMFWLNFSWFVILLGAELSYSFQNVNNFNIETEQQ